jgi:methionyl-tRNA formyltransferase
MAQGSVRPKVVFFGTPQFAVPSLRALLDDDYDVAAVVTAPDRPAGRGRSVRKSPVAELAAERGLLTLQPDRLRDSSSVPMLRGLGAAAGILVAYGQIVPPAVLEMFAHGTLNVHPSLLPRHRGASPIQGALLAGDSLTGVTLMLLDEELDHGPVLAQETYPIAPDDTTATLLGPLADLGAQLLVQTLPHYLAGEVQPQPQDHGAATYTKMVRASDGVAHWSLTAEELVRRWRAYQPWPGIAATWNGRHVKLGTTRVGTAADLAPGQCRARADALEIGCAGGTSVDVAELQLEGGRMLPVADLLRGHPALDGATLATASR